MSRLLSSLLQHSELTRAQLGERTGIAEGRISELLNGKKAWYLEDVERISVAIGLDPWRVLHFAETNVSASREDFDLVADANHELPVATENAEGHDD